MYRYVGVRIRFLSVWFKEFWITIARSKKHRVRKHHCERLSRTACHFSGYLRSVLSSWWNAYSSSSPHGCSLLNQRSYRPCPSAHGGSHQPPRFSPCSVSTKTNARQRKWLNSMPTDFAGTKANQSRVSFLCIQMLQTAFLLLPSSPSLISTISHWTTLTSWRTTRRGKLMEIPTGVAQKYNSDPALFSPVSSKHACTETLSIRAVFVVFSLIGRKSLELILSFHYLLEHCLHLLEQYNFCNCSNSTIQNHAL